jgi:spoIIIJ-associated protein
MEWVETTGRTIDEAKEAALDELGVDETDAEFEILEEPRAGLFGRLRSEARVRARVRPTAPRAKEDRRDRRRRTRGATAGADSDGGVSDGAGGGNSGSGGVTSSAGEAAAADAGSSGGSGSAAAAGGEGGRGPQTNSGRQRGRNGRGGARGPGSEGSGSEAHNDEGEGAVEVALEEQGRIATEFLQGLTAEFGLEARIDVAQQDESTIELQLSGPDLGLLIGPKGSTLLAIQDLTRTAVHHRTGAGNGRINVYVGGYRQKRSEALARFALQVATTVKQSGTRTALEPMSAADRKVVHDALNEVEGVSTVSEGEEPRRRVVVVPTAG